MEIIFKKNRKGWAQVGLQELPSALLPVPGPGARGLGCALAPLLDHWVNDLSAAGRCAEGRQLILAGAPLADCAVSMAL